MAARNAEGRQSTCLKSRLQAEQVRRRPISGKPSLLPTGFSWESSRLLEHARQSTTGGKVVRFREQLLLVQPSVTVWATAWDLRVGLAAGG